MILRKINAVVGLLVTTMLPIIDTKEHGFRINHTQKIPVENKAYEIY